MFNAKKKLLTPITHSISSGDCWTREIINLFQDYDWLALHKVSPLKSQGHGLLAHSSPQGVSSCD